MSKKRRRVGPGPVIPPPTERDPRLPEAAAIEQAAEAAANGEGGGQERQVITMNAPTPGAAEGMINVMSVTGARGKYVRVTYAHGAGLAIIDLPILTSEGKEVSKLIGQAIIDASAHGSSGLVVVRG